ncbi:hypothetical protein M9H77_08032 [Catharanthus roseus]|uniref:Uncharacterized protein n=1 Tax=Catharanthus roseus TaxID=4058 RepID=A0ACC0BWV9_CATRO|nr:hypothetical protein M9H77_08032 [Catharanthus roseus]
MVRTVYCTQGLSLRCHRGNSPEERTFKVNRPQLKLYFGEDPNNLPKIETTLHEKVVVYYPSLVKEFYTSITRKNNKDLINIKTTVNGAWKHGEASHDLGTYPRPNTGYSRIIWNTIDLSPRMRLVSGLVEEKEDEGEEVEGNDEEYDEFDSSIRATLEQMQVRQTNTQDALVDIQDTLRH